MDPNNNPQNLNNREKNTSTTITPTAQNKNTTTDSNKLQQPQEQSVPEESPRQKISSTFPQLPPIRTYSSDAAKAIQNKQASVVKMAIAETKKKGNTETVGSSEPVHKTSKKAFMFVLSSMLILLSIGFFLYIYKDQIFNRTPVEQPTVIVQSLINADAQKEINISTVRNTLEAVKEVRETTQLPVGHIEHIFFTQGIDEMREVIDTQTFFMLINSHAPDILVRSLKPEFMFGTHVLSQSEPFLILKTDSFQNGFAGMLAWENKLREDVHQLFIPTRNTFKQPTQTDTVSVTLNTPEQNEVGNTISISTSTHQNSQATSSEQELVATTTIQETEQVQENIRTTDDLLRIRNVFVDLIIRNKDVRALQNEEGKTLLLYTFVDKETILITTNEDTLHEILDRIESTVYTR